MFKYFRYYLSSPNKNLGWSLYLALLITPAAAHKVEALSFQPFYTKYEITVAGATTALASGVETSSPPKELAQAQRRTTIRSTEQQGEHESRQPVPQWILNVISLEIGLDIAILTTLIRRTLKRQLL